MAGRDVRITVFYCQHIPGSTEEERQEIERKWG
jgi:hypothetical protein